MEDAHEPVGEAAEGVVVVDAAVAESVLEGAAPGGRGEGGEGLGVQLRHPSRPLRQPPAGQHLPGLVHHLHVMAVLSPAITHEQPHQGIAFPSRQHRQPATRENASALINSAHASGGHAIPAAVTTLGRRRGHNL